MNFKSTLRTDFTKVPFNSELNSADFLFRTFELHVHVKLVGYQKVIQTDFGRRILPFILHLASFTKSIGNTA